MLILLIVNFLVRSGRLNKAILVVKNAYKHRSVRLARTALLFTFLTTFMPASFGGNSTLSAVYHHNLSETLPVPRGVNHMLFYLQRDPDENTVVYQLNMKNGEVDREQPVNAFWIKYADKGQIKELTSIQRRLAYGISSKQLANGKHELRFVSYPKLPLYLVKESNGNDYKVFANVEQKELILNRIFVRVKPGAFYFPKVEYIELEGKDASTGRELSHRINI